MKLPSRVSLGLFLRASLIQLGVACSSNSGAGLPEVEDDLAWTDGDSGGEDQSGNGSGTGGQITDGFDPQTGQCRALSLSEGCLGEVFEGEAAALDLLLVFDESGSMSTKVDETTGETRMDIVRGALDAFLRAPESNGIDIGLSYFGQMPIGETSCDPADYDTLEVPFGSLPDHADALVDSLRAQKPTGETPTGAAIRAACTIAKQHREEAPGRVTSILLVTDGEPKAPSSAPECEPTLADAVQATEECAGATGLPIYVLGVGPSLTNLNQIAQAGGTKAAYLADLDNREQVLDALQKIRVAAQIPCGFDVTQGASGRELNYENSTVAYVDSTCTSAAISRVESLDACEDGARAYFFDNPTSPTRIDLCPATCSEIRSEAQQLFYSIGCPLDVDIYE
jgi:Mg-chelatase subunit ChlD